MYLRSDERGPADEQPPGAAHRDLRRRRPGALRRSSSSASGSCRSSTATSTWPRRTTTAPASSGSAPRAARSSTATATSWSPTGPASRCRSTRRSCPKTEPSARAELAQLADLTHTHAAAAAQDDARRAEAGARRAGDPAPRRRPLPRLLPARRTRTASPGSTSQRVFVRRYPDGTLAAHILGSVGEVTEEELEEPRYKGLEPGDEIGQEGVEDTYDRYLRGKPGVDPDPGRRLRPADPERPAGLPAAGPGRQPEAHDRPSGAGGGRSGAGGTRACTAASSR